MLHRKHPLQPLPINQYVSILEMKEQTYGFESDCSNPYGFHPEG
jgi:hypothetical protein